MAATNIFCVSSGFFCKKLHQGARRVFFGTYIVSFSRTFKTTLQVMHLQGKWYRVIICISFGTFQSDIRLNSLGSLGVSLPAKITSENTSENDLLKSSDWFFKFTSNQNFLEGHFRRCFRRLFLPEEKPLYR